MALWSSCVKSLWKVCLKIQNVESLPMTWKMDYARFRRLTLRLQMTRMDLSPPQGFQKKIHTNINAPPRKRLAVGQVFPAGSKYLWWIWTWGLHPAFYALRNRVGNTGLLSENEVGEMVSHQPIEWMNVMSFRTKSTTRQIAAGIANSVFIWWTCARVFFEGRGFASDVKDLRVVEVNSITHSAMFW